MQTVNAAPELSSSPTDETSCVEYDLAAPSNDSSFAMTLRLRQRPICPADLELGVLELLSPATASEDGALFVERVRALHANPRHHVEVVEDIDAGRICGCGTLVAEPKFIHQAGSVGHIEDVVVSAGLVGKGIGARLVRSLTAHAWRLGCYKCIVDCDEGDSPFYEELGFRRKEVQCVCNLPPVPDAETLAVPRSLGDGLRARVLEEADLARGFLQLLAQLTTVGELSAEAFAERLALMRSAPGDRPHVPLVILDDAADKVVVAATLFVEQKLSAAATVGSGGNGGDRGGRLGHIEEVVVDSTERGRGLGRKIIACVCDAATAAGCSRVSLDCSESNVPFYQKCGFERKGVCMALYLHDDDVVR